MLNHFNITYDKINQALGNRLIFLLEGLLKDRVFSDSGIFKLSKFVFYKEKNQYARRYNKDLVNCTGKNVWISVWLQDYTYFDGMYEEIQNEFSVKPESISTKARELAEKILKNNMKYCAVHIRAGDYADWKGWMLPKSFFGFALNEMKARNLELLVFCEDIAYARDVLGEGYNATYLAEYSLTDIEEFYLMSLCKNIVVSNSTFSWWAAYLNRNITKKVFAPVYHQWVQEWYPDAWYRIDVNDFT